VTDLVVDASVAIKWFVAEPDSSLAEKLLAHSVRLSAPHLLMTEIANGLWKHHLREHIGRETVLASLTHAEQIIEGWHADGPLLQDATDMALDLSHPVYDCLYLALARRLNTSCITVDRKLLTVAPSGLTIALADWRA